MADGSGKISMVSERIECANNANGTRNRRFEEPKPNYEMEKKSQPFIQKTEQMRNVRIFF